MPRVEGNKRTVFFTKKDKLLFGVYISAAITCTIIFLVTLVQMLQLKDFLTTTSGNTSFHPETNQATTDELAQPTGQNPEDAQDFQKQINDLNEKLVQYATAAEAASNKSKELETKLAQYETNAEKASDKIQELETQLIRSQKETADIVRNIEGNITKLETKLEEKVLIAAGFSKLSNGLFVKYFSDSKVPYEHAKENCAEWDARLVSESMRDSTTRGEIYRNLERESRYAWIGLQASAQGHHWVWSDQTVLAAGSLPGGQFQYVGDGYAGTIYFGDRSAYFYERHQDSDFYYICEAGF